MRRLRFLALALVGLALPAGLGLAVYTASGSALFTPAATAGVQTGTIGRPSTPPTGTATVGDDTDTDRRGRCDEAENRLDPECTGQTTTTGETTTGRTTTSDDSDSDSSGRSDSSGPGSGSDD
jgi:hypothetical protein